MKTRKRRRLEAPEGCEAGTRQGGGWLAKWCPLLGNESGGVKGVVVKEVVGFGV